MRGGGPVNLLREVEAEWTSGRAVAGTNNWVSAGSTNVPPEWTDTLMGDVPGLVGIDDLGALDPSPRAGSPLIDSGLVPPVFAAHPFPRPLEVPGASPVHGVGSVVRPTVGTIDRGAYEFGSGPPPVDAGVLPDTDAGPLPDTGPVPDAGPLPDGAVLARDGGPGVDGGTAAPAAGCGCRATTSSSRGHWLALGLALLLVVRRARRR